MVTTVMLTAGEVAIVPTVSVATAVRLYAPGCTLLQKKVGQEEFEITPRVVVLARNCTVAMGLVKYRVTAAMGILAGAMNLAPFCG